MLIVANLMYCVRKTLVMELFAKTACNVSSFGPLFFLFFSSNLLRIKIVALSGIGTWIVTVGGKHGDHLTITTANMVKLGRPNSFIIYALNKFCKVLSYVSIFIS